MEKEIPCTVVIVERRTDPAVEEPQPPAVEYARAPDASGSQAAHIRYLEAQRNPR
jgi:hypothetical protein